MINLLKTGEIFICAFPFTSGKNSKSRPVLVLLDFGLDVLICRITSKVYSSPLDVKVRHWRNADLLKPSVVRLGRLVTAEKALLSQRIGELHQEDLQAIRTAWNKHMRL